MKKNMNTEKQCVCPYCDEELLNLNLPFCRTCGVMIRLCTHCHVAIRDEDADVCPECGKPLE